MNDTSPESPPPPESEGADAQKARLDAEGAGTDPLSPEGTEQQALDSDRVAVGRINTTWGLKGHVKVTPFTGNPGRFRVGAVLLVRGEPRKILEVNTSQGYPIVRFDGYTDETTSKVLRGTMIEITAEELPPLPPGEYYVHDLEGLDVVTREGERIGTLAQVLTTGANDVYLVRRAGKPDALIPAIADVVLDVDIAARRMRIEAMPGLLD